MKISWTILVVFKSRGFTKNLDSPWIHLSNNNTFPTATVMKNLDDYIWEYDLFIKI